MTKEGITTETSKPTPDSEFSQSGDLTGDGGVVKEILTHGENAWQKPEDGDDVSMHYRGTLLDGTEFDSSYERNTPFTFKLGDGKVIKGWDIVGKTMAKGEKAKVTLKPEYAYGENGSPPKIPANATLMFEMELLSWTSRRDVFGDGLVVKSEIAAGDGWERPGKLDEITLGVVCTETDPDTKSTRTELYSGEVTFTNGSGQVPPAWEKVVSDMKKDAVLSLVCRGSHVSGPGITYVPEGTECVQFKLTMKSWKKVEDIHHDGSLVKKVLVEGEGWERPNDGSVVTVAAKFYQPAMDSSLLVPPPEGDPYLSIEELTFKVGDGVVVDGLDRVVQSMKKEEKALVMIHPRHAFETAPDLLTAELSDKGVTKESRLLVHLTISNFEKAKDVWSMSNEEKLEEMKARKQIGNELFKKSRYPAAQKSYDRAVAFFDSPTSELSPELKTKVNELLVQCHINLAVCLDRMGDTQKVMNHCKKALEIAPSNIKALYRQGCAYLNMDDFYNASSTLKYALQLSPGNVDLRRKLKEVKSKQLAQDAADKKLYSNLFGRLSKMEEKENKKGGFQENGHSNLSATNVEKEPQKSEDVEMKEAPAVGENK
ncbi:TPR repeat containing protein [Gracilaria domingensis]|nr:TPR repeat containing protein [Gracilaria domingensis]